MICFSLCYNILFSQKKHILIQMFVSHDFMHEAIWSTCIILITYILCASKGVERGSEACWSKGWNVRLFQETLGYVLTWFDDITVFRLHFIECTVIDKVPIFDYMGCYPSILQSKIRICSDLVFPIILYERFYEIFFMWKVLFPHYFIYIYAINDVKKFVKEIRVVKHAMP